MMVHIQRQRGRHHIIFLQLEQNVFIVVLFVLHTVCASELGEGIMQPCPPLAGLSRLPIAAEVTHITQVLLN